MLKEKRLSYLVMECRTGKTLTALVAAEKMGAKNVLFITKKKAIGSVESDYALLKPGFQLEIINYESVQKYSPAPRQRKSPFDLIILDEAHVLGSFPKPNDKARKIQRIARRLPILYLSGTPTPESYSQIFHQFWVSSYSPWQIFGNFYRWAKSFVKFQEKKINGFDVTDYSNANKESIDKFLKTIFLSYSQEEAGFETKIEEEILEVPMTEWTKKAIKTLRKDKVIQWNGKTGQHTVLGDTPATLLNKLHQLSSGTVIDYNKNVLVTDWSKAKYLFNRFKGKKIAIFYVYQKEADILHRAFPDWTDSPEIFQSSKNKTFIAQIRSAREGVRLDSAEALIFYNIEYSYLSYEQGRNRLVSKERKDPVKVYFLCSDCGIEKDIMDAVHEKKDFTLSYYMKKLKKNG